MTKPLLTFDSPPSSLPIRQDIDIRLMTDLSGNVAKCARNSVGTATAENTSSQTSGAGYIYARTPMAKRNAEEMTASELSGILHPLALLVHLSSNNLHPA
jgi:hypothetical protein